MAEADFITLTIKDARKAMVWLDVLADLNSGELEEARELAKLIGEKLDIATGVSNAQD